MKFQFAGYSDIGRRNTNEDAYRLCQTGSTLLAMVADGLGGHANGEVASKIAVDTLSGALEKEDIDEDALAYAILNASSAIRKARISGHSTIAALWAGSGYAVAAHVGDTRIYQLRNSKIIFQSVDHSAVQMAVLVGELDAGAVRHHKDRNKLFRALGEEEAPKVDITELTIQPADRFLLCSDGFWEPVTEEAMLRTMEQTDTAQAWLDSMTESVYAARDPRQDNHTAICIIAE